MSTTAAIPNLDVERAKSIIAEAKNHGMYDDPMPEGDGEIIALGATLVQMARDAKKVADENPAAAKNMNAIMAILYQAEVEGGTSTGSAVIPPDLTDDTKVQCIVMGTPVEWTWGQIKMHVIEKGNNNVAPTEQTPWLTSALDLERAGGAANGGDPAPPAPAAPAAEQPAAAAPEYRINPDATPEPEARWIDTDGVFVIIDKVIDETTITAKEEQSGEEIVLERSDLAGRVEEVAPEPAPEPEPPAAPEPESEPGSVRPNYESFEPAKLKEMVEKRKLEIEGKRKTKKKMIAALEADDERQIQELNAQRAAKAQQASAPPQPPTQSAPVPEPAASEEIPDDDPQYKLLREQAYNDFRAEKGLPIPNEYEGDEPELPLDITSVPDAEIRRLMGQFQAVTSRAKFKWALEHSYERACKRVADSKVRAYMANNTADTATELKARAETQEEVIKWRAREQRHHDRAFAFRQLMEIHAEDKDVCSREISGRELEIKRG